MRRAATGKKEASKQMRERCWPRNSLQGGDVQLTQESFVRVPPSRKKQAVEKETASRATKEELTSRDKIKCRVGRKS